ncbi:MAG TPA: MFS transporter, partial [Micrococcaceae bacterium]
VNFMVVVGCQSIGGPLSGWLAQVFGPQPAIFFCGAVPAVAAVVIGVMLARRGQLTLRMNLRSPRRPVLIVPRAA